MRSSLRRDSDGVLDVVQVATLCQINLLKSTREEQEMHMAIDEAWYHHTTTQINCVCRLLPGAKKNLVVVWSDVLNQIITNGQTKTRIGIPLALRTSKNSPILEYSCHVP